MKLTIYYNVQDCGDGSVSVSFFESKELAKWDDDGQESWAEDSFSEISFNSDSLITCDENIITTKEKYFLENYIDGYDIMESEINKFLKKFFPNGFPLCTITTENVEPSTFHNGQLYSYHHIFIDNVEIYRLFERRSVSKEEILTKINAYHKQLDN